MDDLTLAQRAAVWALPLVFAVTVHEAAHGWVADRPGDPTARKLGCINFNPLPHIDLVGTIAVPPLDGGRILTGVLPLPVAGLLARVEPFGLLILIALLVTGVVGMLLGPVVFGTIRVLPGTELVLGILPALFQ